MTRHVELTMDDLLSDPLTLLLMRADGVDPTDLRGMLRAAARRLEDRGAMVAPGAKAPWREEPDLLRDCVHFAKVLRAGSGRPATSKVHRPW